MKELDVEGLFWRPEEPERKIAGRLRFDPADGATLSLVEPTRFNATGVTRVPITDLLAGGPDAEDAVRFLGTTASHVLTLDGCLLTRSSMGSSGMTHRRYEITTVLMGVHLGSDEPMSFTSASVELSSLASWVGRSGSRFEPVSAEDSEKPGIRLTYEQVPAVEANTDDGAIAVRFPWRYKWNPFGKSMIEHECVFECRFPEPQPLGKLMEVCQGLRSLVTICVQAPSAILDAKLTHPNVDHPIGWYTEWIGGGSSREQDVIERARMAFTCDDIGGMEGIRAWLNLANRYSLVIALLVSHWYVPPLYQEQRYFNAIVAAESLIRIRKQEQNIKSLKKELIDLAGTIETLFVPVVGDRGKWAEEVVRARNNYVVHPGLRGHGDGYRLYLLSESIYLLIVLSVLLECGVAEDSLKNVLNHGHYKWLVEEFAKSAPGTSAEEPCPKRA